MDPLFSVIVPIYGVEKYINQCVDSILCQNYIDFELILVDDGSKDNCPQICDEYARRDCRVKVVHKKNGGLVSARKAGCKIATGKYIVNVDGDDWIKDGYFESIARVAAQYEPDVICFGYIRSWADKERKNKYNYPTKYYRRENIEQEILPSLFETVTGEYFPPSIWSKAVKKSLYVMCQNNVDDRISIGEDVACIRQVIYKAKSMYIMDDHLYYYRQNEKSMTKNKKAFSMYGPELIANIFSDLIGDEPENKSNVCRSIFKLFFNAAMTQFYRKDPYIEIVKDIKREMEKRYVQDAIKNCYFSRRYYKGQVALFCLKHQMFWLMKILNYIEK